MSAPLRIGMLGASRIAEVAILEATEITGDVRAIVAARDPERARAYAAAHGFERATGSYDDVLADDSLDLVYIGLPNGLHAEWTAKALAAGRNVLVEKPMAANLAEFDRAVAGLDASAGWVWEAFHYADHPAIRRLIEIVRSGEIGEVRGIDVHMDMPSPDPADPRWNFSLAGGTVMDLGCYALNALLLLAEELGGGALPAQPELVVESVDAVPYGPDPRLDATLTAQLALGGVPVALHTSMESHGWDFGLEVTGTAGEVFLPNFVKPQEDGRLIVRQGSASRTEDVSPVSSYAYQLRRVHRAIRTGDRSADLLARSRRTIALIDELYAGAGLPLRPARLLD